MIVNPDLVKASIRRLGKYNVQARSEDLGDGPRSLSDSQKKNRFKALLAATGDPDRARRTLERFIGGNDLVSINYLVRGMIAGESVCRIRLHNSNGKLVGYGTGFLIGLGVVMTNHHVLSSADEAAYAKCDFNYQLDERDSECSSCSFICEPRRLCHANKELDFAVVAVAETSEDGKTPLSKFRWLPLRAEPGKAAPGEYLSIIQHPNGERKQVCVRENKLLKYDDKTVWYQTDTVPGSSGSPVLNNLWQVVGLHHSGVPKMDGQGRWLAKNGKRWDPSMDETEVDWIANEGIRISQICAYLQARLGNNTLIQGVLRAEDPLPPHDEATMERADRVTKTVRDGKILINVPIEIGISVGGMGPGSDGPARAAAAATTAAGAAARDGASVNGNGNGNGNGNANGNGFGHVRVDGAAVESVDIDQSNILQRPGYNTKFLGTGDLEVPLPTVTDSKLKNQVLEWNYKGKKGRELKYYNYSVLMHEQRKMAFVAAVNIDGNKLQDVGKREGDQWYPDPRVGDRQITTKDFYSVQLREAAGRALNPFDRGHLVRRLDGTWGASVAIAKRNGDDTFHYTNCTPQFWKFNQGSGSGAARLWAGLEDYVLAHAAKGMKLSVFNGPIFDAPRAKMDDGDGTPYPDPSGDREEDPKLLEVSIPRWFWKVMAWKNEEDQLSASAYLLSQEAFLDKIDDLEEMKLRPLTEAQARAFQVSFAALEKLTGISFKVLRDADDLSHEAMDIARPLTSFDDLAPVKRF
ncbi:MAG TPA: DNA/RNA non-specific endonuclease [Tepidisphaeraceae bacterium]|jgi:endonuclease G